MKAWVGDRIFLVANSCSDVVRHQRPEHMKRLGETKELVFALWDPWQGSVKIKGFTFTAAVPHHTQVSPRVDSKDKAAMLLTLASPVPSPKMLPTSWAKSMYLHTRICWAGPFLGPGLWIQLTPTHGVCWGYWSPFFHHQNLKKTRQHNVYWSKYEICIWEKQWKNLPYFPDYKAHHIISHIHNIYNNPVKKKHR